MVKVIYLQFCSFLLTYNFEAFHLSCWGSVFPEMLWLCSLSFSSCYSQGLACENPISLSCWSPTSARFHPLPTSWLQYLVSTRGPEICTHKVLTMRFNLSLIKACSHCSNSRKILYRKIWSLSPWNEHIKRAKKRVRNWSLARGYSLLLLTAKSQEVA